MRRSATILQHLIRRNKLRLPFLDETLNASANTTASYSNSLISSIPSFNSTVTLTTTAKSELPQSFSLRRSLCSSSSGSSNIVVIDSEEKFSSSLHKVQDEALPAIFYFTAIWCGPCRLLYPIIEQLSEKYPHVTIYKIDIDQEGLGRKLSELNIHSVPTLHFFKDGKKASEVVGADLQRLKDTMEILCK
ncbi:thioredoxin O2, mitochondrial [Actinidia eriantha]|uniref:thioredoxin O2, mitochondrial n=1 Tax=Actinidia eriantha TaxID=165200 RepID=UPI002584401C|nr:thioredoxin O2, mitochondrial [Actinidia eriantha]